MNSRTFPSPELTAARGPPAAAEAGAHRQSRDHGLCFESRAQGGPTPWRRDTLPTTPVTFPSADPDAVRKEREPSPRAITQSRHPLSRRQLCQLGINITNCLSKGSEGVSVCNIYSLLPRAHFDLKSPHSVTPCLPSEMLSSPKRERRCSGGRKKWFGDSWFRYGHRNVTTSNRVVVSNKSHGKH